MRGPLFARAASLNKVTFLWKSAISSNVAYRQNIAFQFGGIITETASSACIINVDVVWNYSLIQLQYFRSGIISRLHSSN